MIIVLNGPLGVGKTETAWALLDRLDRAVMLDGDYLAALHRFDYANDTHLAYACRTFAHLIAFHVENGFRNFVINWVFETPEQLVRLRAAVEPLAGQIRTFRLTCSADELERRVRRRNNPDLAWELHRSQELLAILEAAAQRGDVGMAVDTTGLTVAEVCARVLAELRAGPGI